MKKARVLAGLRVCLHACMHACVEAAQSTSELSIHKDVGRLCERFCVCTTRRSCVLCSDSADFPDCGHGSACFSGEGRRWSCPRPHSHHMSVLACIIVCRCRRSCLIMLTNLRLRSWLRSSRTFPRGVSASEPESLESFSRRRELPSPVNKDARSDK